MNKLTAPALLLVALLLGVHLLLGGGRAEAQSRWSPRWEYRVFRLDYLEYKDKADYTQLLRREGPRGVESAFHEHVLGHLGKEGWEFVMLLERKDSNQVYFYLKRPAR